METLHFPSIFASELESGFGAGLFEVFMPRRQCMRFETDVIWTHLVSDVLIAAAYYSIPLALLYFVRKRRDLAFHWIFLLFAAFILACGTTHVFNVWALWQPLYRLDGIVKAVTAILSVATALILWPLLPRALALPSPEQLRAANDLLAVEIAERRRAEEDLRAAQSKLVRSERLAVLGQLSGGVAHEIRNPLHVISTSLYYLQMTQPDLPARQREHLERIEHHVGVASRIIAELLDYARVPQSDPELFPLWQMLDEALSEFTLPAGVRVTRVVPERPVWVRADRGQLGIVARHLIRNALQAMPEGGELSLSVSARDGCAVAEVTDTGAGIDPQHLAAVFEPLFTTKVKGIGLGLAISKVYVELHGGRLEVESEAGRGATFRMKFPLEAAEPLPRSSPPT